LKPCQGCFVLTPSLTVTKKRECSPLKQQCAGQDTFIVHVYKGDTMKKLFLILCFLIAVMNCAIGEQMKGIRVDVRAALRNTGQAILKVL
jgi:hypothetical protein